MTSRTIEGPEGRLNFDADGDGSGAPVLFVHSDGGTLHHWDEARRRLKGKHPNAAFDRRGHGKSDAPKSGSYSHQDAAADIAAVAGALGWTHFVLVGHSGGALNAFTFAGLNPDSIAGLVLVDPPPDPAVMPPDFTKNTIKGIEDGGADYIAQYYRSIAGPDPKVERQVLEDAQVTPLATFVGTTRAYADFHPADLAPRITARRLSVIQPQYDVEGALHRIAPGMEFIAVENAGHWIHLAAPDPFAAILDAFLEEVDENEEARPRQPATHAHPS